MVKAIRSEPARATARRGRWTGRDREVEPGAPRGERAVGSAIAGIGGRFTPSSAQAARGARRARSSGGQSAVLIRPRSLVRVQARPPDEAAAAAAGQTRGRSLAGRAPPLHGGGPGFESPRLHCRARQLRAHRGACGRGTTDARWQRSAPDGAAWSRVDGAARTSAEAWSGRDAGCVWGEEMERGDDPR